jgi:DNA invertase Pin-like site-specific DNA recombinase
MSSWLGRLIGSGGRCKTWSASSELHSLGIDLALHQQGIDTTTPAGKAMFQMMGVFAEFERNMIVERVRAALPGPRRAAPRAAKPSAAPALAPR